jgi:hypothetical protein
VCSGRMSVLMAVRCAAHYCVQGHVYVKFGSADGASAAYRALNGRFYAGKQIVVSYQFLQTYNTHFGVH